MPRQPFTIRLHRRSIGLAPGRGHQMKKYSFSRGWLLINNFFDMGDAKIKTIPSCSPRRVGSKHVLFDLERSI